MSAFIHVKPSLSMEFNPEPWNKGAVVGLRNCLTYALNAPSVGWAWNNVFPFVEGMPPEEMIDKHRRMHQLLRDRVVQSFIDGVSRLTPQEISGIGLRIRGLSGILSHQINGSNEHVFAYSDDQEHFIRFDNGVGRWSHKRGKTEATNKDYHGNIIDQPDLKNFGGSQAFDIKRRTKIMKLMQLKNKISNEISVRVRASHLQGRQDEDILSGSSSSKALPSFNRASLSKLRNRAREVRAKIDGFVNISPSKFNFVVVPKAGLWVKVEACPRCS